MNSPDPPLPPELRTPRSLLAEAVRLDPTDDIARRRLIERDASYLEYTLHELPVGVLCGVDGASPNECEDLLAPSSASSRDMWRLRDKKSTTRSWIHECECHYNAYAAYLRAGPPYEGYERYLERVGPG